VQHHFDKGDVGRETLRPVSPTDVGRTASPCCLEEAVFRFRLSSSIMLGMRVADIGEFGFIRRLAEVLERAGVAASPAGAAFPLIVGIGDDAAVWRTQPSLELSTTDTMVEGVHFTRQTTPWRDVGWKVMAANLSDIAAMGGTPLYALVTLGVPKDMEVAPMEVLYEGMAWACKEHGAVVAGGDVVGSPVFFVTVALNGYTKETPLRRNAARPGDLVAVSGPLGGSRGGLELMLAGAEAPEALRLAHRHPQPRLKEGRILVQEGVLCAMDISDGLYDDVGKLAAASGCAADVDLSRVPFHSALAHAFPGNAAEIALAGGEDYELLFTAPPQVMERVMPRLSAAVVVGKITQGTPGSVTVLDKDGRAIPVGQFGWDHFRS